LVKVVLKQGITKNLVIEEEKQVQIFDKTIRPDMQVVYKSDSEYDLKYIIEIKSP
jgi:hypothetical protein